MSERGAKLVLGGLLLAAAFALAVVKVEDYDAWTQLALGRQIVEHRGFPATEQFSFPSHEMPYHNPEWLFGLVFYLAHLAAGIPGVILLKASIVALAFFILLKDSLIPQDLESHRALGVVTAAAVLFLVLLMARHRFVERPDIALMVFLGFTIYALDAYVYEGRRYLYFLPMLQVLWVNMHPSIVVGAVPFGAFLAGGGIQRLLRGRLGIELPGTPSVSQLRVIAGVFSAVVLASLLNPYGINAFLAPFHIATDPWFTRGISELQAPGFDDMGGAPFIVTALLVVTFMVSAKRLSLIAVLLVGPFVYLGLSARRFAFLLAIVSAPVLARHLRVLVGRLSVRWAHRAGLPAGLLTASLIVVLTGLSLAQVVQPFRDQKQIPGFGIDTALLPEGALRYLDRVGVDGKVFNKFAWGGYILWRDYPRRAPIVDGRGYVPPGVLHEIWGARYAQSLFNRLVARYGFDVAIVHYPEDVEALKSKLPISEFTWPSPEWTLVYWDDLSLVYLRRTEALARIIERDEYRHVKPADGLLDLQRKLHNRKLVAPIEAELRRNIAETQSSLGSMLLGILYTEVGSYQKAIEVLSRVQDLPWGDNVYLGLAYAYEGVGDAEQAVEYYRKVARRTENTKILSSIGAAFERIGNDREAVRYLERALEREAHLAQAYPPLIRAYRRLGRTDRLEALEATYRGMSALTRADDHFRRGVKLYMEGKLLKARAAFEASLKLKPRNAVALSNLGYISYDLGQLDEAFVDQKRALAVDPRYANAHYGLALIYRDRGEDAMARAHFAEYLRLEPRGYWAGKAQEELSRLSRETDVRRPTTDDSS
jgi:tetratricopeptide (TPR) repeat protein